MRLRMEDGRCAGVEAERGGQTMAYRAKAVLIADGGFQANAELVRRYISPAPEKLKLRCALTGAGDGLRMAQAIGAAAGGLDAFYGHLLSRDAMHDDALWPYPMLDELAASSIMIDASGRRFADEGHGGIYLANAVARLADPLSTLVVFDDAAWQGPGRATTISPNPVLESAGGTVHRADSIGALAVKIGVPAQALERSVAQYNEKLDTGKLAELDPTRTQGRYHALSLRVPPFYAVPVCVGLTYTMGGITIDAHARVLRPDGSVVPGLYAAGSATGGLDGGAPRGYVGGLIKAMVFGALAAEHVSSATTAT